MKSLNKIIDGLKNPEAFDPKVDEVKVLQTHISVVFLVGKFVYKIKKPVNLGFLDFSTIEKRRHYCNEEVRLNKRLCPDIYLDVVTVTEKGGRIAIGGEGTVIDYAVLMKRMPASGMLDVMLENNEVTKDHVATIAQKLAQFYTKARTGKGVDEFGTAEAISVNTTENFDQSVKYVGETISREVYNDIKAYTEDFIVEEGDLIQSRIEGGYIREGHGDLHARNICIADDQVYIYDCIEFNERFRIGDVADDIAFLAMDLDFHLEPGLGKHFVNEYIHHTNDTGLIKMLIFYSCYHAYVRGKVLSFEIDESKISQDEKRRARDEARLYFALSHHYAVSDKRSFLGITFGPSGTGKSALAEPLAEELGAMLISSDVVRKELFGMKPDEHEYGIPGAGIYSKEASIRTYDEIFKRAMINLKKGRSVVLDATFLIPKERSRAKDLAREAGARFFIIETTLCPEEVVKKRIVERMEKGSYSDATVDIYNKQRGYMKPLLELEREFTISVDTTAPKRENVKTILRYLLLNE